MGSQESSLQNFDLGEIRIVQDSGNEKALAVVKRIELEEIKSNYDLLFRLLAKRHFNLDDRDLNSVDEQTLLVFRKMVGLRSKRNSLVGIIGFCTSIFAIIGAPMFNSPTLLLFGIPFTVFTFFLIVCQLDTDFLLAERRLSKFDFEK